MPELTFVVLSGKHEGSTRSRELQDSSARSHAARIAHRRSKLQKLAHCLRTDDIDGLEKLNDHIKTRRRRSESHDTQANTAASGDLLLSPGTISALAQNISFRPDRRDPFNVTPGTELPSNIHDALHFRKYHALFYGELVSLCATLG